jgi:hypothetical protein
MSQKPAHRLTEELLPRTTSLYASKTSMGCNRMPDNCIAQEVAKPLTKELRHRILPDNGCADSIVDAVNRGRRVTMIGSDPKLGSPLYVNPNPNTICLSSPHMPYTAELHSNMVANKQM